MCAKSTREVRFGLPGNRWQVLRGKAALESGELAWYLSLRANENPGLEERRGLLPFQGSRFEPPRTNRLVQTWVVGSNQKATADALFIARIIAANVGWAVVSVEHQALLPLASRAEHEM